PKKHRGRNATEQQATGNTICELKRSDPRKTSLYENTCCADERKTGKDDNRRLANSRALVKPRNPAKVADCCGNHCEPEPAIVIDVSTLGYARKQDKGCERLHAQEHPQMDAEEAACDLARGSEGHCDGD